MAALFGADDHEVKHSGKRVDWARKVPGVRVVGARGRAEGVAEGQAGAAARDQGRGRGDALADAGALRSRRRDRAHGRPVGRHGGGDPGARRALGRPRPAALAAGRADPAAGPHPVPRPDRGDLPRRGRGRRRLRGGHATLGHLVRSRAGAGARRVPAATTASGPRSPSPTSPAGSPRTRSITVDCRPPAADRHRLRGDRRRQVAVDVLPLRPHEPDRDQHGRGARPRRRGARRPAPRRAAARHRQARGLQPDPRQARRADGRRVRAGQGAPAVHALGARAGELLRGRSRPSRRRTTSVSTAAATRVGSTPTTSRSRCACWRWPTSTRRSRPSARTAMRSAEERGARDDPASTCPAGSTPTPTRRSRRSSTCRPSAEPRSARAPSRASRASRRRSARRRRRARTACRSCRAARRSPTSSGSALRYERSVVIALKASQAAQMRAATGIASPASPSG